MSLEPGQRVWVEVSNDVPRSGLVSTVDDSGELVTVVLDVAIEDQSVMTVAARQIAVVEPEPRER